MCILFTSRTCHSGTTDDAAKLLQDLRKDIETGKCCDPTSENVLECSKLEVRHRGSTDWYSKCEWCSKRAGEWQKRGMLEEEKENVRPMEMAVGEES
jgi:hypothetical protein